MTQIDGVEFEACWQRRVQITVGDQTVPFLSAKDLITNKKASGRPQDIADAAVLERQHDESG